MRHRALRSQDRLLAGLIIGLSLFGLAMLLSASGPVAFQQYSDPLHFVLRQVLLGLHPDPGPMPVLPPPSLLMYFMPGAPIVWFVTLGAAAAAGLFLLIKLTPYRAARFMTFLHTELDPQGGGQHIKQAVLAVGSGGLFGLGYGQSRQKFLYLPEVQGDSIFAVLAEELGFLVTVLFLVA